MGALLADGFDGDLHGRVPAEFSPKTTGDLIAAIATINTWNRIGKLTLKWPRTGPAGVAARAAAVMAP